MKALLAVVMCSAAVVFGKPTPQSHQQFAYTQQPIIPYEFAFEVADPPTNNFQNRVEAKLPNGDVFGSWSVLLPDGNIQTVSYNVTGNQGFRYSLSLTPTEVLRTASESHGTF